MWTCYGQARPDFADTPGDGQESVWAYPQPTEAFREILDYGSFYPALVACYVGEERVRPQPGGFYGGWMTNDVAGPVKGTPGTGHW